ERVHGNALEHYRRAWQWTEIIPLTDWGTLYEMPMAELVERQSRADGFADIQASVQPDALRRSQVFEELREASRRAYLDWGVDDYRDLIGEKEGFPSLSVPRPAAKLLWLRIRYALSGNDYAAAVEHWRMLNAIAGQVGHSKPGWIMDRMVGASSASLGSSVAPEWIQRPWAPNLYWGLHQVGPKLVGWRHGYRFLQREPFYVWPELRDPDAADLDEEGWFRLLESWLDWPAEVKQQWREEGMTYRSLPHREGFDDLPEPLAWSLLLARQYPTARRWLREVKGWEPARLDQATVSEAILRYARERFMQGADRFVAAAMLDSPAYLAIREQELEAWAPEDTFGRRAHNFAAAAVLSFKNLQMKFERRHARLIVIEALRHHVAKNGGELPASLNDLELPAPNDPCTGRPFRYTFGEGVVILEDELLEALGDGFGANVRYVVRFREAEEKGGDE
ncbi:MAG: hypothetical protein AAGA92_16295, partial [Planctomycetota bacterium]